jgi:hypothetical protein
MQGADQPEQQQPAPPIRGAWLSCICAGREREAIADAVRACGREAAKPEMAADSWRRDVPDLHRCDGDRHTQWPEGRDNRVGRRAVEK